MDKSLDTRDSTEALEKLNNEEKKLNNEGKKLDHILENLCFEKDMQSQSQSMGQTDKSKNKVSAEPKITKDIGSVTLKKGKCSGEKVFMESITEESENEIKNLEDKSEQNTKNNKGSVSQIQQSLLEQGLKLMSPQDIKNAKREGKKMSYVIDL